MNRRDNADRGRLHERGPGHEVDEELAFHVEQRVRYYMDRGLNEDEARRVAHERLGDLEAVREDCVNLLEAGHRASVPRGWWSDLGQDIRFGVRSAARAPVLTLMAVVTLALGVGVNAAVFGVVKSVLLDSLPYEDGDRLVRVYGIPVDDPASRSALSAGAAADLMARQRSFERMASFYPTVWDVIYRADDGVRVEKAAYVEAGFFEALGVRPAMGRALTREEVEANASVVMVTDALWRREFGGDPAVIGGTVRVDADTWEVIGVLPRDFIGPMGDADLWFGIDSPLAAANPVRTVQAGQLGLIGRLRPGVRAESAARDLESIAADLAIEHPATDGGRTVSVVPIRDSMVGDTRTVLLALMASAALVLLIACANLGGALLSRTMARRGEFAVRVALGAGRGRLTRQLLTETTMLGLAGAAAGLVLAVLGLAALRQLALPAMPAWADLSLDAGAALVMTIVALSAGVLIAVAPALATRSINSQATLREQSGSGGGLRSGRLRGTIVAAQIALCLSLLAGASLLSRSLIAITRQQPGYDPEGVLTVAVKGPIPAMDEARRQFFDRLEANVAALPGVIGVATTSELPGPSLTRLEVVVDGVGPAGGTHAAVPVATVSDGYFSTMRIPILEGRGFGPQDAQVAQAAVLVSESMAGRYWPRGDAVGARVRSGPDTTAAPAIVVGIVGDVRNDPAREAPEPMMYTTSRQSSLRGIRVYVVRSAGDPRALVRPFRMQLEALDPTVPMDDVRTLRELRDTYVSPRRLPAVVLTSFASLALLLACVGVYALFAALAVSREREFAVRIALGSSPLAIAQLALRQGAAWLVGGLVAGAIGAAATAATLRGLLYGVSPLDPLSLLIAVSAILAFGTLAMLVPIRRVIRLDPRTVMR
ncbi:MAG TPA: ADOP family duplicated permease [Longimicrobiales bacterium]|nr:ADOP family duplicated permease [Longimicrobiales bacterium]